MSTEASAESFTVTDWNGDSATFSVDYTGGIELRAKHKPGFENDFIDLSKDDALRLADWVQDVMGQ